MGVIRIGTTSCPCTSTSSRKKKRKSNYYFCNVPKCAMTPTNNMLTKQYEKKGF